MLSVFRITRAEFAKVFKKPTVYIMAFILALVLVIAAVSYSPNTKTIRSISIEGDNASKVYSNFYSENSVSDTKLKLDKTYYDVANNQINFYTSIYNYKTNLNAKFMEFNSNFNLLEAEFNANKSNAKVHDLLLKTKKSMIELISAYENFQAYNSHASLQNIVNTKLSNGNYIYESIFFDVEKDGNKYNLIELKKKQSELETISEPKLFISTINTNQYVKIFENMANCGQNIIYNILNAHLNETHHIQDKYINLVSSSSKTESAKIEIVNTIHKLNNSNDEFKTLIDGLTSSTPILALHTTKNYEKFTNAHQQFKTIYSKVKFDTNNEEFTSKRECAFSLKASTYLSTYQQYLNSIKFLNISKDYIETLAGYKKLADTNQALILNNIEQVKTNTTTSEILEEITNYMLLGETFVGIVENRTTNQFSKNLPLEEMQNCKNVNLSSYNEYNNSNTISKLYYQIENNIYANEVGDTFSINQTIYTKESMLDFTYYALKISTMLIIVFTIMMIANLITSETDSGTIKLLLIRPYRRGTVLMGKILATFFFSLSFLLFSFAVCMTAGYFMYGAPTIEYVLVTFNAGKTFLINPLYLLLIFLATCAGDILFYLIIALTVAVLFKSYIGAISTSLIIYIGAIVVGALLSSSPIYAYLPFTNVSWFRFFGGEIIPIKSGLGTLLSSPVHSFQNFYFAMGISVTFSIILLIITFITFKRRDF